MAGTFVTQNFHLSAPLPAGSTIISAGIKKTDRRAVNVALTDPLLQKGRLLESAQKMAEEAAKIAAVEAAAAAAAAASDQSAFLMTHSEDGTPRKKTIFEISAENEAAILQPNSRFLAQRSQERAAAELAALNAEKRRIEASLKPVSFFSAHRSPSSSPDIFSKHKKRSLSPLPMNVTAPTLSTSVSSPILPPVKSAVSTTKHSVTHIGMPAKGFDKKFLDRLSPRSHLAMKTLGVLPHELLKR